jgi:hypothetical protein
VAYPSLTYRGLVSSTADATTYTFSANDIGLAHENRAVIAFVYADSLSGSFTSTDTTCTIGGISASRNSSNGTVGQVCSFVARVTSGTTADIVVTFAQTMTRCAVAWFTFKPANLTILDGIASASVNTSYALNDLEIANNGLVLIGALSASSSYTGAWNGVDSITNHLAGTSFDAAAEYLHLYSIQTSETSAVRDYSVTGTSARRVILAISFGTEAQLESSVSDTMNLTETSGSINSVFRTIGETIDWLDAARHTTPQTLTDTTAETIGLSDTALRSPLFTVNEYITFQDALQQLLAIANDTINASETYTPTFQPGVIITEEALLADTTARKLTYITLMAEIGGIRAGAVVAIPRTLSETIGIDEALSAVQAVSVIERLRLSDALLTKVTYRQTYPEAIQLRDSLHRFFGGEVLENIGLLDSPAPKKNAIVTRSETVGLSDTLTSKLVIRFTTTEGVNLDDTQVLKMILRPTLADVVEIAAAYVSPNGSITTWAINTKNSAITEYSNYNFNSFAAMGNKYLGASSTGLYELNGDDDAGSDIIARIRSGFAQFGGSRFSSFKAVYLGMRGEGDFVLKLETGDGKTYNYAVVGKNMETTKVHLGKGLRARYFAFELISTGQDFDLDDIEFIPLVAQRRV